MYCTGCIVAGHCMSVHYLSVCPSICPSFSFMVSTFIFHAHFLNDVIRGFLLHIGLFACRSVKNLGCNFWSVQGSYICNVISRGKHFYRTSALTTFWLWLPMTLVDPARSMGFHKHNMFYLVWVREKKLHLSLPHRNLEINLDCIMIICTWFFMELLPLTCVYFFPLWPSCLYILGQW